jgi:uncharacterized protein YqjF (DUF2071 family)
MATTLTHPHKTPDIGTRLRARIPDEGRPQIMHHRWESLLFLHWKVDPGWIQATLPKGLTVDTFEGDAWLGLSPFFMRDVRVVGTPALPFLSSFEELNVRTYVFDRRGVPGIWFYSLDCNQSLAVRAARTITALPYFVAEISAERNGTIDYCCCRDETDQVARFHYRGKGADRECAAHSVEFFLLERYYLYSHAGGDTPLLRGQVSHAPYRYRGVELETWSAVPLHLDGFSDITAPPDHSCYVDGFEVKVYATLPVEQTAT